MLKQEPRNRPTHHRGEWLFLLAIIVISGYFRFQGLDWNDYAWPHPDERAVISQTHDLLVSDSYQPSLHTWGSLSYYSTLFAYKGYLSLQNWLPEIPLEPGPMQSAAGLALPHFRELVRSGAHVPLGIFAVFLLCTLYSSLHLICRHRVSANLLLLLSAVTLPLLYPFLREILLTPVSPNYEDVAFLGRFLSALASTLCVPIIYAVGSRLYSSRVGLLAAAFYGFTVLAIQLGHFFAADMLQTLFVLLAIWCASALVGTQAVLGSESVEKPLPELGAWLRRPRPGPAVLLLQRLADRFPWPTFLLYLAMGGAIGMAMACKFSTAPLFLLPIVAHLILLHRVPGLSHFLSHLFLLLSYIAALGTWFWLQPYAWESTFLPFAQASQSGDLVQRWLHILFSNDFARQIHEQSQMVEGRAGGPWVQQFANTVPYLTMTLQMVRWSFGWPLGLVCLAGFLFAVVRNLSKLNGADLLLLSWAGIEFLIIGQFQASFPRYTIALIPVFCLLGAELCVGDWIVKGGGWQTWRLGRLWSRLRVPIVWAAVAGGFLYSLAFMQIYDRPHSWTSASFWIFKNVPETQPNGQPTQIAHEEWDDIIPLNIPLHSRSFGSVSMAPYHGDGSEKAQRLASELERTDWICLPTTRLYGTILTVQEKYPITARYYKMLFAGHLGFTLRKTVTSPPRLWGWEFSDLLADESQHVYDHPKCVIFEKTEPLTVDEYQRRLEEESPQIDSITRSQIMLWREAPQQQLRNVFVDPYPDEKVMTLAELDSLLEDIPSLQAEEREGFLTLVRQLEETPALHWKAVSTELERKRQLTRSTLLEIRQRIRSLPLKSAISVAGLKALTMRSRGILEAENRNQLLQRLDAQLELAALPRDVVLEKLDRIDLQAGRIPPPSPELLEGHDPERIALITQGEEETISQIWQVLKWLILLKLLGLAVLPLCGHLFQGLPDGGYPLAKTLGLLLASYLAWLGTNLGLGRFGPLTCMVSLLLIAAICWAPRSLRSALKGLTAPGRVKALISAELLFLFTFIAFAAIRAYNPEIYWGEKTMDFSFLNAINRGSTFPPFEPWFSGTVLNYYYYGFVLFSYLIQLAFVPTAFGFNLAIATIPALSVSCAFSLGFNLCRRVRWGLLGATLVGFIGNLDPLFQLASLDRFQAAREASFTSLTEAYGYLLGAAIYLPKLPFVYLDLLLHSPGAGSIWDSYWASSRAIGQGMINEYPVWSWLFADLHAHVMVMPVSLLLLSLIYLSFGHFRAGWPVFSGGSVGWISLLLMSVITGTQLAVNIWDSLCFLGFLVLALLVRTLLLEEDGGPVSQGAVAATSPSGPTPEPLHLLASLRTPENALTILFVALWTWFWPTLCQLHPYWLGLIADRWIGLLVILVPVLLGTKSIAFLGTTRRVGLGCWELARGVALPIGLMLGLSTALFYYFHQHLDTGEVLLKFNNDGNISATQAIRHFGLFLLATLLWVGAGFSRALGKSDSPEPKAVNPRRIALRGLVLEILLFLFLKYAGVLTSAAGLSLFLLLLPPILASMLLWRRSPKHLFCGTLLLGGWGLAAVSELIVIIDRMNTVFKIYLPVWMLLALGSAVGIAIMIEDWSLHPFPRSDRRERGRWRVRPLQVVLSVVFLFVFSITLICTYRGVLGVTTRNLKQSSSPTLNGLNFLLQTPQESELLEAVDWLNRNVAGPQVIAEAFTDRGYDESARVTKYTGLPTLLGWPHHLRQRGHSSEEIALREQALRALYTSQDEAVVSKICEDYDIDYIFVGDLENQQYAHPAPRLDKIAVTKEVFRSSSGSNLIFRVER